MARQSRIDELVASTPASRDRYVDFLRAASIVVVVLGHWTMAIVARRNGSWELGNLLTHFDGGWLLTWVFQVMPVFFFVGGFSNMVTLNAMGRRGDGFAEFAYSRTSRLLKPVLVLLAIWVPLTIILQASRVVDVAVLRQATTVITQPLWFIGIYLIVTAVSPAMRALHLRFGLKIPILLLVGAALVDLARFGSGIESIAYLNFAFVWLFAHQLGFFYADGSLTRQTPIALWLGVIVGIAGLAALTRLGPYPNSMVGLPGETISNMNPPTICLLVLTVWQVSALILARAPVSRWLARPRVWGVVIAANSMIMTVFLWHLTALMLAVVLLLPAGFPQPVVGTPAWWLLRPVWLVILCSVTALFVILAGRFERPGDTLARGAGAGPTAAVGMSLIIVGVCGFAISGLVDPVLPNGRTLIGIPVSPLINVIALGLGGLCFALNGGRSRAEIAS